MYEILQALFGEGDASGKTTRSGDVPRILLSRDVKGGLKGDWSLLAVEGKINALSYSFNDGTKGTGSLLY